MDWKSNCNSNNRIYIYVHGKTVEAYDVHLQAKDNTIFFCHVIATTTKINCIHLKKEESFKVFST